MISYKPFLKLLIDRGIKKQEICQGANISKATMAKMNTEDYVALEVIDKLCSFLECQPGELLEHIPKDKSKDKY